MDAAEFSIEEFKALRSEIAERMQEIRATEVYAVGGAAAIYAWYATNSGAARLGSALAFLPVLFPLLGALRSWGLLQQIKMTGRYIRHLGNLVGQHTEAAATSANPR